MFYTYKLYQKEIHLSTSLAVRNADSKLFTKTSSGMQALFKRNISGSQGEAKSDVIMSGS
jgi:hypothetical protein